MKVGQEELLGRQVVLVSLNSPAASLACLPPGGGMPWPPAAPQDEIGELRRRLAISAHQIDQLKLEVAERDAALQKETYDHGKVGGVPVAACVWVLGWWWCVLS